MVNHVILKNAVDKSPLFNMSEEFKHELREDAPQYALFFKALNRRDMENAKGGGFIPGTVTSDPEEALDWYYRYNVPQGKKIKNKEYGPKRHINRGEAVIVAMFLDVSAFHGADEFQRGGISEHARENCWTSATRTKAQINTPVTKFIELSDEELFSLSRPDGAGVREKIDHELSEQR